MTRVKRGVASHRRHKKLLELSKGYRNRRKNVFKVAKEAVAHAGQNAYRDRRLKKREYRGLWIIRLNAACRANGIQYSRFIYGLELADIALNRKMLSELAIQQPEAFKAVMEKVKAALPKK
ncbi:50S ribosomal protein L20 [Candidatus Peregrinibacteria bacterium]|nr:50S ribosomal protein L20 [Candidatus Peregrinibacteria bacterium]